jgi:NAD(P)-dependent dehydrogenase (short-subunit alcohol dehydrogenase family)
MQNAYASSKAWVRNFTLALAKENKTSGVGVYLFNPGLVDTDMMRHLHFVKGFENNVNTFRTIARLWSNSPEVPAKKAVWLASSATDGRTGLEVNLIGPRSLIAGVVREALRLLLGRSDPLSDIKVSTVEPEL